jgi:hypothetical protein
MRMSHFLVVDALGRAVAAGAGHVGRWALRPAPATGGDAHAEQTLIEQAAPRLRHQLPDPAEARDPLVLARTGALVAHARWTAAKDAAPRRQAGTVIESAERRPDLVRLGRAAGHRVVDLNDVREAPHALVEAREAEAALGNRKGLARERGGGRARGVLAEDRAPVRVSRGEVREGRDPPALRARPEGDQPPGVGATSRRSARLTGAAPPIRPTPRSAARSLPTSAEDGHPGL